MSFVNPFGSKDGGSNGLGHNGFEVSLNYVAGLPDANLVQHSTLKLTFKALLKRDDTTKERALGELCNFICAENLEVLKDDMVLMTWVQLYPKLSVSDSKNVRSLAHQAETLFISVLQRSYAKYLKDTIPVLLTGIYDMDSSVVNSTLKNMSAAFKDTTKINNLWIIFQLELLEFADQVINKETVDSISDDRFVSRAEMELKYQRLVNASISVVSHLIQLALKTSPEKVESNIEKYQEFFLYENLWHYLRVSSNGNVQRIYKTVLSLVNAVIKLKPELLTPKAWKLMTKRLLKSLTFAKKVDLSSKNSLLYSSLIIPIISTLNNVSEVNPSFYENDKSYKERITDFLKLGSLSSNSSYYNQVYKLIADSNIYSKDDFVELEKVLHNDFVLELETNSKIRNGAPFIVESLSCYLKFVANNTAFESLNAVLDEIVQVTQPVSEKLVAPLVSFISDDALKDALAKWCISPCENLETLLTVALKRNVSIEFILEVTLEDLREKAQADEKGETFKRHPCFTVFDFVLKNNLTQYKPQFDEFLEELPSYITPLLIDKPIDILEHYSRSALYDEGLFVDTFDCFALQLDTMDLKDKLLSRMDSMDHKNILLKSSKELEIVIHESFADYDFSTDSLFKAHLLSESSALNLWNLAKQQRKEPLFIKYLLDNNGASLLPSLLRETDILQSVLWLGDVNENFHEEVQRLFGDESIQEEYFRLLKQAVTQSGATPSIVAIVKQLITKSPEIRLIIFGGDHMMDLVEAYGDVIDSRLSIGNPLQTSIYLLPTEPNSFKFEALGGIIRYAIFLQAIGLTDDLFYLSIVAEIATDYEFLNDGTHVSVDAPALQPLQTQLISKFSGEDYASLVSQLISRSYQGSLNELISESNIIGFYGTRLLKLILQKVTISPKQLAGLDFDGFTRSTVRSKSAIDHLIFNTVLSTLQQFLHDEKFERSRILVASETIGLRTPEIITVGVERLVALNSFLLLDNYEATECPLEHRRLNMVISELNKWIDSEVAYDAEFRKVRILIVQLLHTLNRYSLKNDQFEELTHKVLQEASGLISIGEEGIELKYYTLKLFILLQKQDKLDSTVAKDIENELLDAFVNQEISYVDQPVLIYFEMLNRVLSKLPTSRFVEFYDQLVSKYHSNLPVDIKRPLLNILKRLILSKQQDQVIEFELSKDRDDDFGSFKLPEYIIDDVRNVPALTGKKEDEDDIKLLEYLWHWDLVLLNFKDITLRMRSMFIQQLQTENDDLLTKFLDFLSLIIITGADDKSFMSLLEDTTDFTDYDFVNSHCESTGEEVKLLAVHLYFTILSTIGSLGSSWFSDIKDRGFKQTLEKFTTKYISPSLIDKKLVHFENQVDKFMEEHENLTVKVNRITNEIRCTYLIDEQYLEVVFKIPMNYPLSNVEVVGPKRVGVKETQWKAWILACQRIITLQNGELSEALTFLLKNITFHFKGFEECSICYSVLHQDNSLPSKTCSTCKNKFHAGCLYKWFKSSGGNTCPLCRSTFNFR